MGIPRPEISQTTKLAGAAVFGALAAVTTFSIQIPYPVPGFTFLVIDPAELVDVLSFMVFGPGIGFLTAVIHWIVLNFLPSASPIFGPILKLTAVCSMLFGMWMGHRINNRLLANRGSKMASFGVMLVTGLVVRVIALTPINYVFLIFVFAPGFSPSSSFLTYYLGGLAVFNSIHAVFSASLPLLVMRYLSRVAPQIEVRTWLSRTAPFSRSSA